MNIRPLGQLQHAPGDASRGHVQPAARQEGDTTPRGPAGVLDELPPRRPGAPASPGRRRRLNPDFAAAAEFAARAAPFGLSDEALRVLAPRAPRDHVTAFFDARQDRVKADTLRRVQMHVAESEDSAFYVSGDIHNLGGLNAAMNDVAERANLHFKAITDLAADALAGTGADIIPMRTGGDEIGVLVIGQLDEHALAAALETAHARIRYYAQDNGLADIPHAKREGEKGVGLHAGWAQVLPGLSLTDIFTQADLGLHRSKNHVQ